MRIDAYVVSFVAALLITALIQPGLLQVAVAYLGAPRLRFWAAFQLSLQLIGISLVVLVAYIIPSDYIGAQAFAFLLAAVLYISSFIWLLRRRIVVSRWRAFAIYAVVQISLGLALLAIVTVTRTFIVQSYSIVSTTMQPTQREGDVVYVRAIGFQPSDIVRGDIVAYRRTDSASVVIQRVVGLPGETLRREDGRISLVDEAHPEGTVLAEPYLNEEKLTAPLGDDEPRMIEVPADTFYVLGDDREDGYGYAVPASRIIGIAFWTL